MTEAIEVLDVFTDFATDPSLEDGGAWFPIGKGARLLVARAGNRKYGKTLNKLVERNEVALKAEDDAADKLNDDIMIESLAVGILLGWEKVFYQGKLLDYSVQNAKTLLKHREFRRTVIQFSEDVDAFRVKKEKEQGEA